MLCLSVHSPLLDHDAVFLCGRNERRSAVPYKNCRGKGLQFLFVEELAIADVPRARDHRRHAIIRMVWASILVFAGIVNWIVYKPGLFGSPFSTRVWIPPTPEFLPRRCWRDEPISDVSDVDPDWCSALHNSK